MIAVPMTCLPVRPGSAGSERPARMMLLVGPVEDHSRQGWAAQMPMRTRVGVAVDVAAVAVSQRVVHSFIMRPKVALRNILLVAWRSLD